jgi:hypothetical protein
MNALIGKERDLLLDVVRARASDREDLLQAVIADEISARERAELCEILGSEFAERGLDADSEPNSYGLRLERLIDSINRPNLHPSK